MKITSIIENTSEAGLPVEHGLSLYIQLNDGRNILFDMGQGSLFAHNAATLGLSIADVDTAVISHGHYDHGGGLRTFLQQNSKANVYLHRDAFQSHWSLRENGLAYIGLDRELEQHERLVRCTSLERIDNQLTLFADVHGNCCNPPGNKRLFGPTKKENDTFTHEQNLLIEEGNHLVLLAGCAHNGIVNIIRKAEQVAGRTPTQVLAGMHLTKSGCAMEEEQRFITKLASELMACGTTRFHTMHCTGREQFGQLKDLMGDRIEYLSCGESVEI